MKRGQDDLDNDLFDVTGQRLGSGTVVVDVRGEIDIDTAPDIETVVHAHLDGRSGPLVLDLTGVTFMGSAGLNLLVGLKVDCEQRGVDLRLIATSRAVLRPLELTDLLSEFVVVTSVEAAQAS